MKTLLRSMLHASWRFKSRIDKLRGKPAKQIIICGYPRSGTSLLYNMVSTFIVGFRCEQFELEAKYRLHRSGSYVTKFPLDVLAIEQTIKANTLDKMLYFIIVTRDIRDVITSRHPNLPSEYFIGYKNSWWPQNKQFSEWKYDAPGIESIYKAIETSRLINGAKILEVKYEELVKEPNAIQREIEEFTNVKFSGNFQDFYKWGDKHAYKYVGHHEAKDASLVRENKKVDNTRISKWKNPEYAGILKEQFSMYPELFDILIKEGYEKDKEWFKQLV